MVDKITAVILTLNEESNISRSLDRLQWVDDIVVVDSFSNDNTEQICRSNPKVRFFQRKFDSHSQQWNYAISETDIKTEWILALDADYIIPEKLEKEIRSLQPPSDINAFFVNFDFAIHGKILPSSVYPAIAVLFRKGYAHYEQDGHTQRLCFKGNSIELQNRIILDDRKNIFHWIQSQNKYAKLEAQKIVSGCKLSMTDRIREKIFLAPILMFFYCLFVKKAIFSGWSGVFYAMQRLLFELILSLYLIELKVKSGNNTK